MTCHIISPGYNDAKGYVKLRWFDRHFPDHDVVVEIDNPNSIHAFNRSEEEGHAGQRYDHLRFNMGRVIYHGSTCHP